MLATSTDYATFVCLAFCSPADECILFVPDCEKLVSSQRHIEHFSSLFNILLKYTHGVNLAASRAELFSAYGKVCYLLITSFILIYVL